MPTPSTAKWAKPRSEDEFEDIVVDFVRVRWKDPNAQRHGRRGQRQHGVDIVGRPQWLNGSAAAAQCKNTDNLTLSDIAAEVAKAVTFPGGLGEFYLVTSGDRDAALQSQVRAHFRANPAPFDVEVIFWPDIVADLSADENLVAKHWHGFNQPTDSSTGFAPPRWIGRDGAKPNEKTESNTEFAIQLLDRVELDATELRVEFEKLVRTSPSDYVARTLLEQTPTTRGAISTWAYTHRQYDNVVDKWELEIGDAGYMARRWAKFSTHDRVHYETYELFNNVLLPLHKYAAALVAWKSAVGGKTQSTRARLRLSHRSTTPPRLHDNVNILAGNARFSAPVSPDTWEVTLEEDLAVGPKRIALRFLNRAAAKFVEQGSVWYGEDHRPGVIQIDEAAYAQLLAKSGL